MKKVIVFVLFSLMLSAPITVLVAQDADQSDMDFDSDMMMMMMGDSDYVNGMGGGGMGDGMMGRGMMYGGMGDMMHRGMMGGMMGNMGMSHCLRMYAMLEQIKSALNITPDQLVRLQNALLDFVRASAPIEANIKVAETELLLQVITLLNPQAPQLDMNQADTRIRNLERLKSDFYVGMLRLVNTLRGILTADQRQKLHDLMLGMASTVRNKAKMPQQKQQQQSGQQGMNP